MATIATDESTEDSAMEGTKYMTVALLCPPGQVILGRKTKKIGRGLFNGAGGVIEPGETIDQATLRELEEETGVLAMQADIIRAAIVHCYNWDKYNRPFTCKVFVSRIKQWQGQPHDTQEMTNFQVFNRRQLPLKQMLAGDASWMPHVLTGERLQTDVYYAPDMEKLDPNKPRFLTHLTEEELNSSWKLP